VLRDGPPARQSGTQHAGTQTVVRPILHGPNGEDGTIQGLLEIADVPYVGAGVLSSAMCMDKPTAKTILDAAGIAQVRWRSIRHYEAFHIEHARVVLEDFGPTVFVKPANMGSSIGVSKVNDPDALLTALSEAFRYDDVVIVEHGVSGRELECGVIGNEKPRASVVGEVVTEADFYDYGDKYFDSLASTLIPAELDPGISEDARLLSVQAFEALRCEGMARVDLFLSDEGQLLVNEINTIPGFTPISMFPKLWEASGLHYSELIDELVQLAVERHTRRSSRNITPS
jgi:D-alanine-D-alanine ligase